MRKFFAVPFVAAAVCLALVAGRVVKAAEEAAKCEEISIDDLKKAIDDKKVTVIDVNGTDSYKAAHIPTAIDYEANADKLKEVLPKEKDALVVAYCGGPQCGAYKSAAKAAMAMGYTNVKHLKAGISGWKEAGEKTEKAG